MRPLLRPCRARTHPSLRTCLQLVNDWWFWTIIGIIALFFCISAIFVWRGFRNYRRYKAGAWPARAPPRQRLCQHALLCTPRLALRYHGAITPVGTCNAEMEAYEERRRLAAARGEIADGGKGLEVELGALDTCVLRCAMVCHVALCSTVLGGAAHCMLPDPAVCCARHCLPAPELALVVSAPTCCSLCPCRSATAPLFKVDPEELARRTGRRVGPCQTAELARSGSAMF